MHATDSSIARGAVAPTAQTGADPTSARAAYAAPRLTLYGSVRDLTAGGSGRRPEERQGDGSCINRPNQARC